MTLADAWRKVKSELKWLLPEKDKNALLDYLGGIFFSFCVSLFFYFGIINPCPDIPKILLTFYLLHLVIVMGLRRIKPVSANMMLKGYITFLALFFLLTIPMIIETVWLALTQGALC